ncbi:MAG: efflux RND transporter permease subunit [Myxococcales bacterium]|nr:efflux RND transporter permease subunit [Myxococcales bacterium]
MIRGLSRIANTRPVMTTMLFVSITIVGVIAWIRIPLQRLPTGFDPPFLQVVFPTPNGSVDSNERDITLPAEEMFATVRGLKTQEVRVLPEMVIFDMEFVDGLDMDEVHAQIRDRLDRLGPTLPMGTQKPLIREFDPDGFPVVWITVKLPDKRADAPITLEREVVRRVERVPGVSNVTLYGVSPKKVLVELDRRAMQSAGVSARAVLEKIQRENFSITAGVVSSTEKRRVARSLGMLDGLEALRALPVTAEVTVGDLATVSVGPDTPAPLHRINGQPATSLAVFKSGTANIVDVAAAVRQVVENELPTIRALNDFDFHVLFDQGEGIATAMTDLGESGAWGGLIAVFVLYIFLRRWAMTMLIAGSIPLSLLITIVILYFSGESLNALSMMGLMLSIGMVVDNSVVVVENLAKNRVGSGTVGAADYGTDDVATAIVTSTLTSVVVFLPLIFLSGEQTIAFFLGRVGFPVCFSLLASLVVALIFIPVAAQLTLKRSGRLPPSGLPSWLLSAYRRPLLFLMRHPIDAAVLFVAIAGLTVVASTAVKEADQAEGNINDIRVIFSFPAEYGPPDIDRWMARTEQRFLERAALLEVESVFVSSRWNEADTELRLFLVPPQKQVLPRSEIVAKVADLLESPPGVRWRVGWQGPRRGDAEGAAELALSGPDTGTLETLGNELVRRLSERSELHSVTSSSGRNAVSELEFRVQDAVSRRLGLPEAVVAMNVSYQTRGGNAGRVWVGSDQLEVIVRTRSQDRNSTEALAQLPVDIGMGSDRAASGTSGMLTVPMGAIAVPHLVPSPRIIRREHRKTNLTVTAQPNRIPEEEATQIMLEEAAAMTWPEGYGYEEGERRGEVREAAKSQKFTLLLAICLVFLLMGVLFESLLLPLIVIVSIPFGFTGAFWLLWVTGTPYDYMAKVGMVILVGVVVNNGIVLVDRVLALIREGTPVDQAIPQGCADRLRPVLMTALTTICGLIPMLSSRSGLFGIPYHPLAVTVIGGLVSSTFVTLFAVPVFLRLATPILAAKTSSQPAPAAHREVSG